MWQSLGGFGLAFGMLASLFLALWRGWVYTRRQYLDLLTEIAKREKLLEERIADLKESAEMLRAANRELEAQKAILISGRMPS